MHVRMETWVILSSSAFKIDKSGSEFQSCRLLAHSEKASFPSCFKWKIGVIIVPQKTSVNMDWGHVYKMLKTESKTQEELRSSPYGKFLLQDKSWEFSLAWKIHMFCQDVLDGDAEVVHTSSYPCSPSAKLPLQGSTPRSPAGCIWLGRLNYFWIPNWMFF